MKFEILAQTSERIRAAAKKTEHIFQQLGSTTTQAIALFYKQVELRRGLPFDVAIPDKTARETFSDTDAGRNLIICNDTDDIFKKLGI